MMISASRLRQNQQMLILRWILGSLSALALALSLYVLLVERDYEFFRPLGPFLLLPLLLASTLFPGATKLLHVTALLTLAVLVSLFPQVLVRLENSVVFGALGLWLIFYWLQVWNGAGLNYFGYAVVAAACIATLWFGKDFSASPTGSIQQSINGMLLVFSLIGLTIGGALVCIGRARS